MISIFYYIHLEFWTDLGVGVLILHVRPCATVSEINITSSRFFTINILLIMALESNNFPNKSI